MFRVLAVLALGAFVLAQMHAPHVRAWLVQLATTEAGHWLAPACLGGLLAEWIARPRRAAWMPLHAAGFLALLAPALQAAHGSAQVAHALAAHGWNPANARPFSWLHLFTVPISGTARRVTLQFPTSNNSGLRAECYLPAEPTTGGAPVLVLLHGGGWDSGTARELEDASHRLASTLGVAVISLDYQLAPQATWPSPRVELTALRTQLEPKAAELGLDLSRVVFMGRSAGAQIALATAYTEPWPGLRGVIALYGPADLRFAYRYGSDDDVLRSRRLVRQYLGGPPETHEAAFISASAIEHVRSNSPPTLLIHGVKDGLVWCRQSERLAAVLASNAVPHAFIRVPWGVHALDALPTGPGGQWSAHAMTGFLRRQLELDAPLPPSHVQR
jgi:acetyl esterase/lipase